MTTRREVLHFFAAASLAAGTKALAQDPKKIRRVGVLALSAGQFEPVREGLTALGYVDGKNIRLEERIAGDDYAKLGDIANEFVKLNVDVIIALGSTAATSAHRVTSIIPIVMVAGIDPVKAGMAASLSRPGGNVTGLVDGGGGDRLIVKRFELAKELIPKLKRIGFSMNPDSRLAPDLIRGAQTGAKELKLDLQFVEVRAGNQFEAAIQRASQDTVQALVFPEAALFIAHQKLILDLAAKFKIPAIYASAPWVDAGGLASYGGDSNKVRREAARYVDRILRGAKPADLPIEEPKALEVALNLRTARALGLKIPEVVMLRANKVVE